ncbi:hypothetical protein MRX96_002881 [Rhipicephalus microplus]
MYDHAGSSEEEKLLWQMLDRVNLNASDGGEKPTSMTVCRLLEKGVAAVLGTRKPEAASLDGSACAGQHVPHILSQEFQPNASVNAASVSVSVAPSHCELDKALQDLVKAQRWKSFTIVYEKPEDGGTLVVVRAAPETVTGHRVRNYPAAITRNDVHVGVSDEHE